MQLSTFIAMLSKPTRIVLRKIKWIPPDLRRFDFKEFYNKAFGFGVPHFRTLKRGAFLDFSLSALKRGRSPCSCTFASISHHERARPNRNNTKRCSESAIVSFAVGGHRRLQHNTLCSPNFTCHECPRDIASNHDLSRSPPLYQAVAENRNAMEACAG